MTDGIVGMGDTTEVVCCDDGASWEMSLETPFDKPHIRAIFTALYGAMFAATVLGNLLVIFVILRHRRMRTVINCFLANLALSDLLVGVFCVLPNLYSYLSPYWHLGRAMCKMYYFVQDVCHTASTIVMMVIALERYIAIVHPMINKRLANVWIRHVTSAVVWLVAIVYGAPLITVYDVIEAEDVERSHHDVMTLKPYCVRVAGVNMAAHVTINFALCYCAPLVLLALVYSRIGCVLVRTSKLADELPLMVANNNNINNKRNYISSPCSSGIRAKSPPSTPSAASARSHISQQLLGPSPKPVIGRAFSVKSRATASILTARGLCRLSVMDRDRQAFPCHHQVSDCHWQRHMSAKCYCQKPAGRDRIRNSGRQYTAECSSSPDVVFPTFDGGASDADSTDNFLDNIVIVKTALEKQSLTDLCAERRGLHSPTHKLRTSKPSPLHLHILGLRACKCMLESKAASNNSSNTNNTNCLSESAATALIIDDSLIHARRHPKQAKTSAYVFHHRITEPMMGRQQQTPQTTILQKRKWPQSSKISVIQSRRKVVRLLVVVVTSFALCSLPYQTYATWQTWRPQEAEGGGGKESGILFSDMLLPPLIYLILYFNSCLNPFLYALLSENFRKCLCDSCRGCFLIRLRGLRRFSN